LPRIPHMPCGAVRCVAAIHGLGCESHWGVVGLRRQCLRVS
jgi:hypothetical protein